MEFTVRVHPKLKVQCILKLDDSSMVYATSAVATPKIIYFSDVTGCNLKLVPPDGAHRVSAGGGRGDSGSEVQGELRRADLASSLPSGSAALTVFYYPSFAKKGSRSTYRKRQTVTFVFASSSLSGENNMDAEKVFAFIKSNLKRGACCLTPSSRHSERFCKKVLVLINPKSGSGKASNVFQYQIKPMFEEAALDYEVRTTSHPGHAVQMMKELNMEDWYGVVIISGDGLAYEVYQGLMSRADWQSAVRLPIGMLPGGSGNALSCSVNYAAGEPVLETSGINRSAPAVMHSTFVLLKHDILPMDLVAVDTLDGQVYSFLSVTWGLVADIDTESEKYRSLGNLRFTVGAIARILNLRKYRGKVSFLPVEPYTGKPSTLPSTTIPHSRSALANGMASQDGSEEGAAQQTSLANEGPPGTIQSSIVAPSSATPADISMEAESDACCCPKSPSTPAAVIMPKLDEPVPENWVTIEEEFITVCACYQTHLGPDALFSPKMTFNAGYIDLVLLRSAGATRSHVLQLFSLIETGMLSQSPLVEIVRVTAFRIEPEALPGVVGGGNLMVDGERARYGCIQGRVLPAAGQLMAKLKSPLPLPPSVMRSDA